MSGKKNYSPHPNLLPLGEKEIRFKLISNQKGVTLIEVVFSVILSIVIIIPFFSLYTVLQNSYYTSYKNVTYLNESRKIIDQMEEEIRRAGAAGKITTAKRQQITFQYAPCPLNVCGADRTVDYTYSTTKNQLIYIADNTLPAPPNPVTVLNTPRGLGQQGLIRATAFQYYDSAGAFIPFVAGTIAAPDTIRSINIISLLDPHWDYTATTPTKSPAVDDTGTASAGTATTLTDGTKAWTANHWFGYYVMITEGAGAGHISMITTGNTVTQIQLSSTCPENIDNTSKYVIFREGYNFETGTATDPGTQTTLIDKTKYWGDQDTVPSNYSKDQWDGSFVYITAGTNAGYGSLIQDIPPSASPNAANTDTQLNFLPAFLNNTDNTSQYEIIKLGDPVDSGTINLVANITASKLTDGTKSWEVNHWKDGYVYIKSDGGAGAGTGQLRKICSSDATSITVSDNVICPIAQFPQFIQFNPLLTAPVDYQLFLPRPQQELYIAVSSVSIRKRM